jgi:hypothetical protein
MLRLVSADRAIKTLCSAHRRSAPHLMKSRYIASDFFLYAKASKISSLE